MEDRRSVRARNPRCVAAVMLAAAALLGACGPMTASNQASPAGGQPAGVAAGSGSASAQPGAASSPVGIDWIFISIAGYKGEMPSGPPVAGFIMTTEGKRVAGSTGCNRMTAGFEMDVAAASLKFTLLANTRAMCDVVSAGVEESVLDAMIATAGFRIDDGRLVLLSAAGKPVARLVSRRLP